jgi:hypothetical protein
MMSTAEISEPMSGDKLYQQAQRTAHQQQRAESAPPSLGVKTDRRGEPEQATKAKRGDTVDEEQIPSE